MLLMCAGDPEAGPDGAQEVQAPLWPQSYIVTLISVCYIHVRHVCDIDISISLI